MRFLLLQLLQLIIAGPIARIFIIARPMLQFYATYIATLRDPFLAMLWICAAHVATLCDSSLLREYEISVTESPIRRPNLIETWVAELAPGTSDFISNTFLSWQNKESKMIYFVLSKFANYVQTERVAYAWLLLDCSNNVQKLPVAEHEAQNVPTTINDFFFIME